MDKEEIRKRRSLMPAESQRFIKVHDFIRWIIEDLKDFERLKMFMELYLSENVDNGTLKTILIITKSFKEHPIIGETRKTMVDILEKKLGEKLI